MLRSVLSVITVGMASKVAADVPNVATDIAPVHSLVSRVMDGIGEPDLIVPAGASPHSHSMRPSEARALQSADVVFWVGEELTPWMEKPLGALAGNAQQIELLRADGTILHEFREFDDEHAEEESHHEHDDHHDGHDDGHEEHAENHDDHEDHAEGHDDHDDEHDDHVEGHDDHADDHEEHAANADDDHHDNDHDHDHHHHEGTDPHAWLDPENARIWVGVIADTLAASDPDNAQQYRDNAAAADAELAELQSQIANDLEGMQARRFITFHDAYQYFENRFGLETSGTVSLGDAAAPGPARLAALQETIAEAGVECAFAEPQYDTRLIETAIEGANAEILELDPIGVSLEPGAGLYPALLLNMTRSYQDCAK